MKTKDVRVGSLVKIVRSLVAGHVLPDVGKIGLVLEKHWSYSGYLVLVEDRPLVFNSYEFEVLSEV